MHTCKEHVQKCCMSNLNLVTTLYTMQELTFYFQKWNNDFSSSEGLTFILPGWVLKF